MNINILKLNWGGVKSYLLYDEKKDVTQKEDAGVEDTEGVTINGKNGGNATYYGGGGGGASKASSSGATSGRGGSGYRGIVILHYLKNG